LTREQKNLAERIIGEKAEAIQKLESNNRQMEERLSRLESELGRLEQKSAKDKQKKGAIEDEVERYRSQRVDDAMLIERLRKENESVKQGANEIIGVLASL